MLEILFQYGSFTIRTFNIFLALSFFFSGVFFIRFVNRQKMNLSFFSRYFLVFFFAVIIGGRLVHVFEHLSFFLNNPLQIFFIWDLHFSFFGILYTFLILLFVLTRRSKEDFWAWADAGILSILVAMTLIHLGHFFNGTEYGIPTNLPWGVAFDTQNIPFFHPIHPTQIYASLVAFVIFIYSFKKNKRIHLSGVVGNIALMLYSLGMFGIDFLHGTPSLYVKISFAIVVIFSFISLVHCSHKTHKQKMMD